MVDMVFGCFLYWPDHCFHQWFVHHCEKQSEPYTKRHLVYTSRFDSADIGVDFFIEKYSCTCVCIRAPTGEIQYSVVGKKMLDAVVIKDISAIFNLVISTI